MPVTKKALLFIMLLMPLASFSQDREALRLAWEEIQRHHPEVASFEATDTAGEYQVRFERLPFEGRLKVLVYDVEALPGGHGTEVTHAGYVEVELVGASEEALARYARPYYRWQQSNTLFLDQASGQWMTGEEYSRRLQQNAEQALDGSPGLMFWEYSHYILFAVVIYFFLSSFASNSKVKQSIEIQKRAEQRIDESLAAQRLAMEEAARQTALLVEIRDLLARDSGRSG